MQDFSIGVCGIGRVGLPLLASIIKNGGAAIGIDIRPEVLGYIREAPFKEEGLQEILNKHFVWVYNYDNIVVNKPLEIVIITVGTPIDKNHNPSRKQIESCIKSLIGNKIIDGTTLIILRSTVFPGATRWLTNHIKTNYGFYPRIVFAPERIAEGIAIKEIKGLPQPIGALNNQDLQEAATFFKKYVCDEVILMDSPEEAELVKLFSNAYRYVNFALANEFAMISQMYGASYDKVRNAVNYNYPRAIQKGIPKASLNVAGYCLSKDWCLLTQKSTIPSVVSRAYEVAEKTPIYYLNLLRDAILPGTTKIGVLGLTFKPESDNPNDSLSFKVIKILEEWGAKIMTHDPYYKKDKYWTELNEVVQKADIIIVVTEHSCYKDIKGGNVFRI